MFLGCLSHRLEVAESGSEVNRIVMRHHRQHYHSHLLLDFADGDHAVAGGVDLVRYISLI